MNGGDGTSDILSTVLEVALSCEDSAEPVKCVCVCVCVCVCIRVSHDSSYFAY